MSAFGTSSAVVEELVQKGKEVAKGKTLAEAQIDPKWMRAYGAIARRCRDDEDFGLTRYPSEQGPSLSAFTGGFLEHQDWPLRRAVENHNSIRPVFEYEANYATVSGYWMASSEAAICLRQESIDEKKDDEALLFDVWSQIAVRYGLRVMGLRCQLYRLVTRDLTYAKLVMPTLEQRSEVPAADDLVEPMERLDSHIAAQLMKAVATLAASNATKRASRGGPAGG